MQCAVKSCNNNRSAIDNNNNSIFNFPRNKQLREQWLQFCGKTDPLSTYWGVCEYHFRNEDLIGKVQRELGISRKLILKEGAVPSIAINDANEIVDHECEADHNYATVSSCSSANCRMQIEKLNMEVDELRRAFSCVISPKYKSHVKHADNVSKQETKMESPKQKRRCTESQCLVHSSPTLKNKSWKEKKIDQDAPMNVEQKVQQLKQILPNWNHNSIISTASSTSSKTLVRRTVICKDNDDDEWSALGKLITTNARTWSTENMAFARSYKAELSAINAKFELQAAKMTHAIGKNSSVSDVVYSGDDDDA